jgi:hypothetical protein
MVAELKNQLQYSCISTDQFQEDAIEIEASSDSITFF